MSYRAKIKSETSLNTTSSAEGEPGRPEARSIMSQQSATYSHLPEFFIGPTSSQKLLPVREILVYREVLYFLMWRDLKVRYKQTLIGICWAVLQPLFNMVIFTIVFSIVVGVQSNDIPYPV